MDTVASPIQQKGEEQMNKDCLITGIFMGALLCSLLMLLFPKAYSCEVAVGDVNHTVVRYGVMRGEF